MIVIYLRCVRKGSVFSNKLWLITRLLAANCIVPLLREVGRYDAWILVSGANVIVLTVSYLFCFSVFLCRSFVETLWYGFFPCIALYNQSMLVRKLDSPMNMRSWISKGSAAAVWRRTLILLFNWRKSQSLIYHTLYWLLQCSVEHIRSCDMNISLNFCYLLLYFMIVCLEDSVSSVVIFSREIFWWMLLKASLLGGICSYTLNIK